MEELYVPTDVSNTAPLAVDFPSSVSMETSTQSHSTEGSFGFIITDHKL